MTSESTTEPKVPTDVDLRAYQAQTERCRWLTEFLLRFAPSIGERNHGGYDSGDLLDRDAPPALAQGRNQALRAAFEAVEMIARNS